MNKITRITKVSVNPSDPWNHFYSWKSPPLLHRSGFSKENSGRIDVDGEKVRRFEVPDLAAAEDLRDLVSFRLQEVEGTQFDREPLGSFIARVEECKSKGSFRQQRTCPDLNVALLV